MEEGIRRVSASNRDEDPTNDACVNDTGRIGYRWARNRTPYSSSSQGTRRVRASHKARQASSGSYRVCHRVNSRDRNNHPSILEIAFSWPRPEAPEHLVGARGWCKHLFVVGGHSVRCISIHRCYKVVGPARSHTPLRRVSGRIGPGLMHDPASELPRTPIPRTPVNRGA